MTTLTAGPNGVIMSDMSSLFSTQITSTNANSVQVTEGLANGDTVVLSGNFQLSGSQVVGGTVTAYDLYDTAHNLVFVLSNLSVAVSTYQSYVNSNDAAGLAHYLLPGGDTYIGSNATDVLVGLGGNDYLGGQNGNETFVPSAGRNNISGGSGADTVVFKGPSSGYSIVDNGNGQITVTDSDTARNGTNNIENVQLFQFTDNTLFDLTPAEAQIALLYQGTLGRTPDGPGLVGWEKAFAAEPISDRSADAFTSLAGTPVNGLPDLIYGFTQSTEFQRKYFALTDAQFVTQLYANVLDRQPDQAGLNAWINALAQGHTRDWVVVGIVESPEAYHNAEVGYIGQSGTVHPAWLTEVSAAPVTLD
jgi:hypothetical protein